MKMSALFGTTLREAPAAAASVGDALLARAGLIRDSSAGRVFLPLGARVLARIEAHLLRALQAEGAQGLAIPAGPVPTRAILPLARTEVRSWRQLPRVLVARGPSTVHAWVLDADEAVVRSRLGRLEEALLRVASDCALSANVVEDAGGRALVTLDPAGETEVVSCEACGYAALREAARFARAQSSAEEPLPLEKVATPGCTSIEELAAFLHIAAEKTAKAVFLVADEETLVFAVVRGDRDVSEPRLRAAVRAERLRPASDEEIRAAGAVPGYASPIGVPRGTLVVADPEAAASANLVAGANEAGYHLLNTNVPRDYVPSVVADIAALPAPAGCPDCGKPLSPGRAFLLGGVGRSGPRPGEEAPQYQDAGGKGRPVVLAELRASPERILAAVAETHRDERGIIWPAALSPFDAHVVSLGGSGSEALREAERLCGELSARGREALLDDREESPGVKFADADLVGVPVRITVSARSLAAGGVEVKRRDQPDKAVMDVARALEYLQGHAAHRNAD